MQDISLVAEPRKYVLHNASAGTIELQYEGETRWIPPYNVVVAGSAVSEEGKPIPGTLTIADIILSSGVGGEVFHWNAANAVKHWLGVDDSGKLATSLYAKRGLSLLPANPSKSQVAAVNKDGATRAKTFVLAAARQEVAAYDQLNFARRAQGASPLPPTEGYEQAIAVLTAYSKEAEERAKAVLNVQLPEVQETVPMLMDEEPPRAKPIVNTRPNR